MLWAKYRQGEAVPNTLLDVPQGDLPGDLPDLRDM